MMAPSSITCRRCWHVVRAAAGGKFCPHCGLEQPREAGSIPFATLAYASPPSMSSQMLRCDWATVGEFSVGQFHAAKAVLGRYSIPCRIGDNASDLANLVLEVPSAALVWARSLLAGQKR